ncbi:SAM-dependent methyltransferase [Gammaproteobacteria bacterium]|nr:SAM-dependent methyltransferase [Gammaproteobacteria bacterium]
MASLYLIPTVLNPETEQAVLPIANTEVIRSIKHFIVENIRTTRRFLKKVDKSINIDELTFYELNTHTDRTRIDTYLKPLSQGLDMGIISEAGCPAIADPGADVVGIAQSKNIKVVPLVGPSSILLSLMGSGFNGQSFAFVGYLPIETSERGQKLKQLEKRIYNEQQTQIFIETPYRNNKMLEQILKTMQAKTKLCIAVDITGENEYIVTKTMSDWKKQPLPELHKRPCIFLLYK